MALKKKNRIEIADLRAEVRKGRNMKLLLINKNSPSHLTVSWQNPTNEIDIHLTKRTKGNHEDYQSIANIPESDFIELGKLFELEILKVIKDAVQKRLIYRVKPEWLEQNGFVIFAPRDESQKEIANKLVKKKNEWTQIFDLDSLENTKWCQGMRGEVFLPSVLHSLAAQKYTGPVFARGKGRKSPLIVLHLMANPNEKPYWVAMKSKFLKQLRSLVPNVMLGLLSENDWAKITTELRLDDVASI